MDSSTPFQPWAADDSAKNVKTEREVVGDAKLHRENVNPKHTQTASYDKESVAVPSVVPGSSGASEAGADPARGKDSRMDTAKISSMQQIVENTLRYIHVKPSQFHSSKYKFTYQTAPKMTL